MHGDGMPDGWSARAVGPAAGGGFTGVRLRVGVRQAVVPGGLDRAFALVADGTLPPDAAVEVVVTPATVACRSCGGYGQSVEILAVCSYCGTTDVDVSDGDELVLEALRPAGPGAVDGVRAGGALRRA
jgi:hydrogenase nickel incorporation protein HypA/HybF